MVAPVVRVYKIAKSVVDRILVRVVLPQHLPQQLETGAASTIQDIAKAEKVSDRFVGRMIRLAYLSPNVLETLVITRKPPALSLNDLMAVADRPWTEQMVAVFS